MKISELHPSLRPYERLETYGAEALSDEELIAIVIRNGSKGKSSKDIASQLLSNSDNPDGLCGLYKLSLKELSEQEGVGRVKAIVLKDCLELGRRSVLTYGCNNRLQFLTSEIAEAFFEEKMAFLETEEEAVDDRPPFEQYEQDQGGNHEQEETQQCGPFMLLGDGTHGRFHLASPLPNKAPMASILFQGFS